ncbi:MAG: replication initiator protein [Microviridae sp.]|nr:MAG: replication initiator protein [Microviridae sp.]
MALPVPCFHPLKAFRDSNGIRVLNSDADLFNLLLPCGRCIGCRLERSRQWAIRCMHEASLHEFNSFVTLTYDDAHVPADGGLHHAHFQKFMKRLRKRFPQDIRYYMCGEYGPVNNRPHFHVILFGLTFTDLSLWKRTSADEVIFRSATLEKLWPFGFSSIGAVTFQSCAYVARYIMQKQTGDSGAKHYRDKGFIDTETGEVFGLRPEYNRMSLRPAIGKRWFEKFGLTDVFPHDRVVYDGSESKPPRYYDKLFSRIDADGFANIQDKRILDSQENLADSTPARLIDKETVLSARVNRLKRGFT